MQHQEIVNLVELSKVGDEQAYEALYRSFYPVMYRYAVSLTHCEADAHDATQEALIQAHRHLDGLENPEVFSAWLKRITFHQCTRIFRKNTHVVYNDKIIAGMESKVDPSIESNPSKSIHFQNDRDLMVYFFGMLPQGQRKVMELYYFDQMKTKEIAERLDIPEGTVKSRIFSAKKELRTKIKLYEKTEDITLDFHSDALLSFLGQGSLLVTIGSSLSNMKNLFISEIGKTVAFVALTGIVGISGYAVYKQIIQDNNPKQLPDSLISSQTKQLPKRTFHPTTLENQEIKTAQDAYFKILLWSNNEADFKSATLEECYELETMLKALEGYGGYYYELLEKQGWVTNFYKYSKINERIK